MRIIPVALFVVLFLILTIPVMIAEWIIGKFNPDLKNRSSIAIVSWAFRCVIFLSGTRLTVIGEENVPKDKPVLYIGNHRSYFDVVITYARVPHLCGYISKREIEFVPLLNVWMKNLHCLFLDRTDVKKGMKVILDAINKVKSGISICVFPEGTRNTTSEVLLPFRDGSLKIAERSGCPIIPMVLNNTEEILINHIPWIHKTHVVLEYCQPIDTKDLTRDEKRELSEKIQQIMLETYEKNKALV